MKIWNYIGEFFLFRWLFDKLQSTENNDNTFRESSDPHGYSSNSYGNYKCDRESQSYNDFHEEQDDYDMVDDF